MTQLNLSAFVPLTENEGPGRRAALWTQGCLKRCPGCCNDDFLQFDLRALNSVEEIFQKILKAQNDFAIEGVTFLGGEPFLQALGLAKLAQLCQQAGLSVIVFSGYTTAELTRENFAGTQTLLDNIDLLVDGPYIATEPETKRNWCGSKNQQFHYLSTRYNASIETDPKYRQTLEIAISKDSLRLGGFPMSSFS